MNTEQLINWLLGIGIVVAFLLFVISRALKMTIRELLGLIKDMFSRGANKLKPDNVPKGLGDLYGRP